MVAGCHNVGSSLGTFPISCFRDRLHTCCQHFGTRQLNGDWADLSPCRPAERLNQHRWTSPSWSACTGAHLLLSKVRKQQNPNRTSRQIQKGIGHSTQVQNVIRRKQQRRRKDIQKITIEDHARPGRALATAPPRPGADVCNIRAGSSSSTVGKTYPDCIRSSRDLTEDQATSRRIANCIPYHYNDCS